MAHGSTETGIRLASKSDPVPSVVDVVVRIQRVLAQLPSAQHESAIRRILDSVNRIEANHMANATVAVLERVPLYFDRPDRRETALAFFERHYRPVMDGGDIFADDVRRRDPRLYRALSAMLAQRGSRLSELIPLRSVTIRKRSA